MDNLPHWRRMWTLNCAAMATGLKPPYDETKLYGMMYDEEGDKADVNSWWEHPKDSWLGDVFRAATSRNWWEDSDPDAEVSVEDMRKLADKCFEDQGDSDAEPQS